MPDFVAYEVSDTGVVRTRLAGCGRVQGRVLKPDLVKGYHRVTLCNNGMTKRFWVHVLVNTLFNGPKPGPEYETRHIDSKSTHNVATNLEWATHAVNMSDRVYGAAWNRRISDADVIDIRAEHANATHKVIEARANAEARGISFGHYYGIATGAVR